MKIKMSIYLQFCELNSTKHLKKKLSSSISTNTPLFLSLRIILDTKIVNNFVLFQFAMKVAPLE